MKKSDVKDFASTKHKKLPEKKVAEAAKRDNQIFINIYIPRNVNEESNPRIPRKKGC